MYGTRILITSYEIYALLKMRENGETAETRCAVRGRCGVVDM